MDEPVEPRIQSGVSRRGLPDWWEPPDWEQEAREREERERLLLEHDQADIDTSD